MEPDNIDEFFPHYCFSCNETVCVSVIFCARQPATFLQCVINDCLLLLVGSVSSRGHRAGPFLTTLCYLIAQLSSP